MYRELNIVLFLLEYKSHVNCSGIKGKLAAVSAKVTLSVKDVLVI